MVVSVSLPGLREDGLCSVREQHRWLDANGGRTGADADAHHVRHAGRVDSDSGGPAGRATGGAGGRDRRPRGSSPAVDRVAVVHAARGRAAGGSRARRGRDTLGPARFDLRRRRRTDAHIAHLADAAAGARQARGPHAGDSTGGRQPEPQSRRRSRDWRRALRRQQRRCAVPRQRRQLHAGDRRRRSLARR